jgi:hypothetical protein
VCASVGGDHQLEGLLLCAARAVPMQVIVRATGPWVTINACVWPSDRAGYGHGSS